MSILGLFFKTSRGFEVYNLDVKFVVFAEASKIGEVYFVLGIKLEGLSDDWSAFLDPEAVNF